jgi:hypothetical protein
VCAGRENLGTWKVFLKKLIIYIYISASECVLEGEKKNRTKLVFQRERVIRQGEEKPIQARQIFQFKSVKVLGIA